MNKDEKRQIKKLTKLLKENNEPTDADTKKIASFQASQSFAFGMYIDKAYRYDKKMGIQFLGTAISAVISLISLGNADEGLHILKEISQQTKENLVIVDKLLIKEGEK